MKAMMVRVLGTDCGSVVSGDRLASGEPLLPYDDDLCFQHRVWGGGVEVNGGVPRRYCPMVTAVHRQIPCKVVVSWVAQIKVGPDAKGNFDFIVDTRNSQIGQGANRGDVLDVKDLTNGLARGEFTIHHPGDGWRILQLCMWARGSGYSFTWVAMTATGAWI